MPFHTLIASCYKLVANHLPSPVYGVIFLFKYPTGEKRADKPRDGSFDHDAAENIFFAAQTIQNACGTQALLSVLLNKDGEVDIGPSLREFKEFTTPLPSDVRYPAAALALPWAPKR